jgi:energy-coupling factor transporter ATP-binding protein EcfA2
MTAPTLVQTISRQEFLTDRWDYRAGGHVTILGPTDCGKTTLAYQLLDGAKLPKVKGIILVMKPRDETAKAWSRALNYRIVRSWPPLRPSETGWTLWPRHSFNIERDDTLLRTEFQKALQEAYRKGNRIVFADEVYGLVAELGLTTELRAIWTRGRSMGTGLWAASQRPTHIPTWAYDQAAHLFLFHDPDKRCRERFSEIGGVNPHIVADTVLRLEQYQCLYIRRRGNVMCIIEG